VPNTRANEYYANAEEFAAAFADAMREEYQHILTAGLLLQIDDPSMLTDWEKC
jgi:5-methyltetrahydropteroyltriglutamate--homocysteine methyltransferase